MRLFLLPINVIYFLVTFVRNKLYDWQVLKSYSLEIPTICIGNLNVGGSGKTPTTEYLARLLAGYKVAILSRGYGRKTKGFILADEAATADSIGDEPLQYFNKLKGVTVAVCEDRVAGVKRLMAHHQVILLDDAFQHRRFNAGLKIVLFEQAKLKSWQMLLPAGNLREPYTAVQRADMVLVTKADKNLSLPAKKRILRKLPLSNQITAFSTISYKPLKTLFVGVEFSPNPSAQVAFLLSGIANPIPLENQLKSQFSQVLNYVYPDHHRFQLSEIEKLVEDFQAYPSTSKIIITTEKDRQRLLAPEFKELLVNLPIYYLPIIFEVDAQDKLRFDQKIIDYVASFRRIN